MLGQGDEPGGGSIGKAKEEVREKNKGKEEKVGWDRAKGEMREI